MTHIHNRLMQRNGWYAEWHQLPDAQAAHWAFFMLSASLIALMTIISGL